MKSACQEIESITYSYEYQLIIQTIKSLGLKVSTAEPRLMSAELGIGKINTRWQHLKQPLKTILASANLDLNEVVRAQDGMQSTLVT